MGLSGIDLLWLLAAGALAGVASTVAGLASLVSYPALLAVGLPPVAANVTNTVALLGTTAGAVAGSRPELAGQGARLRRLALVTALGGAVGAGLLLTTPGDTFALVVPWLVGSASLLILLQPRLQLRLQTQGSDSGPGAALVYLGVFAVAVYGGYFGAAAGVLMLALLSASIRDSLLRVNALKNVVTGFANGVAAVAFAFFAPVSWLAAAPLGAGLVLGGAVGPAIARRLPAGALRTVIAAAGLALAVSLWLDAAG